MASVAPWTRRTFPDRTSERPASKKPNTLNLDSNAAGDGGGGHHAIIEINFFRVHPKMLWDRLEILLTPRLITLRRTSINRWRQTGARIQSEPVEQAENGADWRAAVAALGKVLAGEETRGARLQIAVSDLWVRSHLIPAASSGLSEDEMLLLARTHYSRQYPEGGQESWAFRLALQGTRLLAAGIESELLQALNGIKAPGGAKPSRIEPLFAWTYDRHEKALAGTRGWMLLDEPGMLTAAYVERGQLMSLHCQRCEADQDEMALQLLERQRALLAQQSVEVRVFSVDARPIRLPAPWRVVWHQRIFGDDKTPALTPSQLPVLPQY